MDDFEDHESPQRKAYWAQRHGAAGGGLPLDLAIDLFRSTITGLRAEHFLQKWTGYSCVDSDEPFYGTGGADLGAYAFRKTRLRGIWPPGDAWDAWDRDHLLTAIEFFHDVVAEPVDGYYHSYSQCGYHGTKFSRRRGRERYRAEVEPIIVDLDEGYEIDIDGLVIRLVPTGLEELVEQPLPASSGRSQITLDHAIATFRARGSTEHDQLDALRHIIALLESLRPQLKTAFQHKDESDLFEIANRFNVRHADLRQKTNYDRDIFLAWLFYSYVAAVHAAYRLIERQGQVTAPA